MGGGCIRAAPEVRYRKGWAREQSGQNGTQVPNQRVEGGRQPIKTSTREAGQGRRPGLDDGVFGMTSERIKYKGVNCTDLEQIPP